METLVSKRSVSIRAFNEVPRGESEGESVRGSGWAGAWRITGSAETLVSSGAFSCRASARRCIANEVSQCGGGVRGGGAKAGSVA